MKLSDSFVDIWAPRALGLLRIVAGFLFIAHGTMKLLGFPAPFPMEVPLFSLIGLAGVMELLGGALLILGLFTRPVAFLLSGEMAFAYFIGHAGNGFWPVLNEGELAALYCFVFLYLAVAGGGAWSLDRWMQSRAASSAGSIASTSPGRTSRV